MKLYVCFLFLVVKVLNDKGSNKTGGKIEAADEQTTTDSSVGRAEDCRKADILRVHIGGWHEISEKVSYRNIICFSQIKFKIKLVIRIDLPTLKLNQRLKKHFFSSFAENQNLHKNQLDTFFGPVTDKATKTKPPENNLTAIIGKQLLIYTFFKRAEDRNYCYYLKTEGSERIP